MCIHFLNWFVHFSMGQGTTHSHCYITLRIWISHYSTKHANLSRLVDYLLIYFIFILFIEVSA